MKEANKNIGRKITLIEARKLMAKFLPAADETVLRFLDKVLIDELAGDKVNGLYKNEVIYAMKRGENTFTNIIRHETFHKIFNEYLSKAEQEAVVKAFKKQFPEYKDKGLIEIEELLAEKFQDYKSKKLTGINKILTDFFNWLSKVFGFYNMNANNITRLFETIESGYFVTAKQSGVGVQRSMRDIVRRFGNGNNRYADALEVYTESRILIESLFSKLYNKGYRSSIDDVVYPVTRKEVKQIAAELISDKLWDLKEQRELLIKESNGAINDEIAKLSKKINVYKKTFRWV
jgi:hypothetical protein